MRLRSSVMMILLAMLGRGMCAPASIAESLEPPPESPEGQDYEAEPADSLEDGSVELSFGAAGQPGDGPRRTRRLRFSADSLGGGLRDGDGDPLEGGGLEGRTAGGSFGIGRLAPRWGRGLLIGSPSEPWSLGAFDRGSRAAYRGRAGDGAWFGGGRTLPYQVLYGRFAGRGLGGASARLGGVGLGTLTDGRGETHVSFGVDLGDAGSEAVLDRRGRWRAEAALERPLGAWTAAARVRGGHARYRSLAEPKRSGPARTLSVGLRGNVSATRLSLLGALWRFEPGLVGARAALEAEERLPGESTLLAGLEEQHGVRRAVASATGSNGFRQGWWCEWRGGARPIGLGIRHEGWGSRRLARQPVRAVTTVRAETEAPAGIRLRVTHAVFRVRAGESVYLPEVQSDRLVLRALSGVGDRTRVEIRAPFAGGSVGGALSLSRRAGRATQAQWSLDWTKRTRLKHGSRART